MKSFQMLFFILLTVFFSGCKDEDSILLDIINGDTDIVKIVLLKNDKSIEIVDHISIAGLQDALKKGLDKSLKSNANSNGRFTIHFYYTQKPFVAATVEPFAAENAMRIYYRDPAVFEYDHTSKVICFDDTNNSVLSYVW